MNWNGWPIERIVVLFVGLAFFIIFLQVTLFHYRQNFRHWAMWVPVVETPLFGLFAILFGLFHLKWLLYLLTYSFIIGAISGIIGSFYHIRGVGQRVDGYKLRNFMIGPPLTLPGMIFMLSILGLIALYWG